ncbi:MAG TPA: class I SAM-dependent methyltransferase [Vicinamibacterales bacterium]|jgi:SAM-dependent methyltransferase|nr:class I SAM-dependent methyltransferase [Vicinamibacterales bacterium]
MQELDRQIDYWNEVGPRKPFAHPVNFDRLAQWLTPDSCVLDFGCGYGRVLDLLHRHGYRRLIGVDPSPAMATAAGQLCPSAAIETLASPPRVNLRDASVDAVLLFAVLTCVPGDEGQRAIVAEVRRVLRPGGLMYISDLWLQQDARNTARYLEGQPKYGRYGIFDLPEGVTLRHHDRQWIADLTADYETTAIDEIQVQTMNGNTADGFQWFGMKPHRHVEL